MNSYSTYALFDAALMIDAEEKLWTKGRRRPRWLVSLYDRQGWNVSPFIVDIEAAYLANRLSTVSEMLNFAFPQVHVSFIDTALSMEDLAEHLRQFMYVTTVNDDELTLRIADCVVLPWLHEIMGPEQWAALHGPIMRWQVHSRDGVLSTLPKTLDVVPVAPPIHLSAKQVAALSKAHEPELLMANLRSMRYGYRWAESPQLEIQLAERILRVWGESGQTDATTLLVFARGVFDTKGGLLQSSNLQLMLKDEDMTSLRLSIEKVVALHRGASI